MKLFDPNPEQLQYGRGSAVPLFLLHDGGGTIFNYHLLGDMGRDVYGIQDPKFSSHDGWSGGIPEMARAYVELIRKMTPSGAIVLGDNTKTTSAALHVIGIIMIDSPYTPLLREHPDPFAEFVPEFPKRTPQSIQASIIRRLEVCDRMLETWDAPLWPSQRATTHLTDTKPPNEDDLIQMSSSTPPPTILIKAASRVPVPAHQRNRIVDVDMFRDEELLGWRRYPGNFITEVHGISGDHFGIFDDHSKIDRISKILDDACKRWERSFV
nr:hypothetical protein CFP56_02870 [Quercus suber]